MRLDAYIRVSRVAGREGPGFISPTVQREQIDRWATFRGAEIATVHTDLDVSGAAARRAGLDAALERIEAGLVDGLVVAKVDRFARSLTGALDAIKRIDAAGATFVSIAEGIDPSTPAGKMMQRLMLILAEYELDRVRESWRESRRRAVARGVHVASRTPTGYERNDDGTLRPGPFADRIREVYERRGGSGASWTDLAKIMEGVPTPYGATHWTSRSLQHLISNRAYLGEARSGEFRLEDAHEAIVDVETWQAAQRPVGAAPASGTTLLAGILRCAGCRYAMKPGKTRDRSGELVRQYHCRGTRAAGTCESRAACLGSVVEPWIVESFFDRLDDVAAAPARANERVRAAEQALDRASAELAAYRDEELIEVIGKPAYLDGLRSRATGVEDAESELAAARDDAGVIGLPDVGALRETWEDLEVSHQRQLLSTAIDVVFLRNVGQSNVSIADRALILWRGEAPAGLPGRGHRNAGITPYEWSP